MKQCCESFQARQNSSVRQELCFIVPRKTHCDGRELNNAARMTGRPGSLLKLWHKSLEEDKVRQVVRLKLLLDAIVRQFVVDRHDAGIADENVEPRFALCKLLGTLDASIDRLEVETDEFELAQRGLVLRFERLDCLFGLLLTTRSHVHLCAVQGELADRL